MDIRIATDKSAWNGFLAAQPWSPFLQSWTMGDVYARVGQEPVRLELRDGTSLLGICFGHIVPARRGRHLAIPYGPVLAHGLDGQQQNDALRMIVAALEDAGREKQCAFVRMSPFWPSSDTHAECAHAMPSPLHMLAEHVWYLDLRGQSEESILAGMRKTTRNLIRRAEREGVSVRASARPVEELKHFLTLHEETRKRHGFTPYTDAFFVAQVEEFSKEPGACTLYLAEHEGNVLAASVHMHMEGETSYHHGASTHAFPKIPASYLLQWTAITDALRRGDSVYNFWGIAPSDAGKRHPFAGVTLFKTGFGGQLLTLRHCMDIPLSKRYYVTRAVELFRKWRRGF